MSLVGSAAGSAPEVGADALEAIMGRGGEGLRERMADGSSGHLREVTAGRARRWRSSRSAL